MPTRLFPTLAWLVFGAEVAYLAIRIISVFATPENVAAPTFGTAWAPYSDALSPWFEGGVAYWFGLKPLPNLYRPTVGLFWGSILAVFGRPEAVAFLFCAWLLAVAVGVMALGRDRILSCALLVTLGMVASSFAATWGQLYISSTAVDFPSMVLTLTGALLTLWRPQRGAGMLPLLAGCACLGLAAAIRGPMLFGGPVILALRLLLIERASGKTIAAACAAFLLPVVIDVLMQRHLGVTNNGIALLYCVYSDAQRTWTPACHSAFLASGASLAVVIGPYVDFILSPEGRTWFLGSAQIRLGTDLRLLQTNAALAMLIAASLAVSGDRDYVRRAGVPPVLRAALVVFGLAIVHGIGPLPAIRLLIVGVILAGALRLWRALACLAAYGVGTAFLCAAGIAADRLQHTFSFMLFLGAALLVLEERREEARAGPGPDRAVRAYASAFLLLVFFLYAGSFVVPSRAATAYQARVAGDRHAAVKVADDPRIDRSLYFSGQREFVYTRHDDLPIGSARHFQGFASPSRVHQSFIAPNAFMD